MHAHIVGRRMEIDAFSEERVVRCGGTKHIE